MESVNLKKRSKFMKYHFIINPCAGGGKAWTAWHRVLPNRGSSLITPPVSTPVTPANSRSRQSSAVTATAWSWSAATAPSTR